jgi:hypothetical protein
LGARREHRTLTVGGYAEAGGIREAVATTAERAYNRFDPVEQELARRTLLLLVRIVPDAVPNRRRVDRARLVDEQLTRRERRRSSPRCPTPA